MILHDTIKTIKNKVFPFSLQKEQNLVPFQQTQKKEVGCFFLKNPDFTQPWVQTLKYMKIKNYL